MTSGLLLFLILPSPMVSLDTLPSESGEGDTSGGGSGQVFYWKGSFEASDEVFSFVYYHSWIRTHDRVRGNIYKCRYGERLVTTGDNHFRNIICVSYFA